MVDTRVRSDMKHSSCLFHVSLNGFTGILNGQEASIEIDLHVSDPPNNVEQSFPLMIRKGGKFLSFENIGSDGVFDIRLVGELPIEDALEVMRQAFSIIPKG